MSSPTTPHIDLEPDTIATIDRSGLLADVLALPDHLRDAVWRVESARLKPVEASSLLVAGMGGSAIGGDLARAVLGDAALRPIASARGYGLPAWTTPDTLVLCSSYSGATEETLAAYEAAGALGAPRIVATTGGPLARTAREDGVPVIGIPGGMQPRCAVAYMLVGALEAAALCDAGPTLRAEIDVAAAHAERLVREWGPDAPEDSLAKTLARALHGTIPIISGAATTAPVASRWKGQINENAETPAFASELPELDHNEIVGWEGASEVGRFTAIFLADRDQHPRLRQRIELTQAIVEERAAGTFRIEMTGDTAVERIVALVLLGDLVSIYLAVLRGVDPTPVDAIGRLKAELANAAD